MKKQFFAVVALSAATLVSSSAFASLDLAKSKNCLACHTVDKKIVGPAFQDVAAKYAGDKTAEAALIKQIKEGGTGKWGAIPMPPQPQVSAAEAAQLSKWILSLRK